jgi:diadenosine tetraphosphatase ApaH/serine/threonine PP2A family protein phosphatase
MPLNSNSRARADHESPSAQRSRDINLPVTPVGVLYDIHGNLPALEAVLEDARGRGIERFVLGGDYALFGPSPAETVEALRALPDARWIRGNVDRWTAHPDQAPDDELLQRAIADCREVMDLRVVDELDALDEQLVLDGARFCHASPISDLRSFMPEPGDDEDELLEGIGERRVFFGHTHLQFRRGRQDGIELVNPGSVGQPMDGDVRAAYALLAEDGSVELRRVSYDNAGAAAATRERFGEPPWVTRTVARLQTAQP